MHTVVDLGVEGLGIVLVEDVGGNVGRRVLVDHGGLRESFRVV